MSETSQRLWLSLVPKPVQRSLLSHGWERRRLSPLVRHDWPRRFLHIQRPRNIWKRLLWKIYALIIVLPLVSVTGNWKWKLLSCVQLVATPWTVQSMEFCRQDARVGSHSLLQGVFPTQGLDPGLHHCRRILYQLSHHGSPSVTQAHIILWISVCKVKQLVYWNKWYNFFRFYWGKWQCKKQCKITYILVCSNF